MTEVVLWACNRCGRTRVLASGQEPKPVCEDCLVGSLHPIVFTAQHEGAVRVKLEIMK